MYPTSLNPYHAQIKIRKHGAFKLKYEQSPTIIVMLALLNVCKALETCIHGKKGVLLILLDMTDDITNNIRNEKRLPKHCQISKSYLKKTD